MKLLKFFLGVGVLTLSPLLIANDSKITIENDQINYELEPDIEMESETLTIGIDEIRVDYVFRNHSKDEKTIQVGFPLPATPVRMNKDSQCGGDVVVGWDTLSTTYQYIVDHKHPRPGVVSYETLSERMENVPFINFTTLVDGKKNNYRTSVSHQLLSDRYDSDSLKRLLSANNIPLSAGFLHPYLDSSVFDVDRRLKKRVKNLGLLDEKDCVTWKNQATYHQRIKFKANDVTSVSHRYRPYTGGGVLAIDENDKIEMATRDPDIKKFDDLNPTEEMKKLIAQNKKAILSWHDLKYILKTGGNWKKGCIKKFKLIIKTTPAIVFNTNTKPAFKRIDDNTFVFEAENFVPEYDLRFNFIELKP